MLTARSTCEICTATCWTVHLDDALCRLGFVDVCCQRDARIRSYKFECSLTLFSPATLAKKLKSCQEPRNLNSLHCGSVETVMSISSLTDCACTQKSSLTLSPSMQDGKLPSPKIAILVLRKPQDNRVDANPDHLSVHTHTLSHSLSSHLVPGKSQALH